MEFEDRLEPKSEPLAGGDTSPLFGGVYGVPPKILFVIAAAELVGKTLEVSEDGPGWGLNPVGALPASSAGFHGSVIIPESTVGIRGTGGGVSPAYTIVFGLGPGVDGCEVIPLLILDDDRLSLRLLRTGCIDLGELMLPLLGVPSISSPLRFSSSLNKLTSPPPFVKLAGEFFALAGLLLCVGVLPTRECRELRFTLRRNRCG